MPEKTEPKKSEGLHLDKKTMLLITCALIAVMVIVGVLTQVVPRGEYDTTYDSASGQTSVVNGTYHSVDYKMPIWKIILSPILCFGSSNAKTALLIIVMISLIGGTFLILDKCGVLKYLMAFAINKFSRRKYLMMALIVFFFMALSSTAGILEESVTLVPLAVAISLALGWDSLTGLGMSLIAVAWGFTAATFNPFNVVTVQKLAGLKVFSGLWYRLIVFVLVYAVLMAFLLLYVKRIEKHPEKSVAYESDNALREKYTVTDSEKELGDPRTKKASRAFVICLGLVFVCIICDFAFSAGGMVSLPGMALLFTVGGLSAGYISGIRGKKLAASFFQGIKTIAPALPLIVFVVAIAYILDEGKIIHTILYYTYQLIGQYGPYKAILLLFLFVALLELLIGSGTAKAFLIMPVVLPLADMVGVTRQSVVLSFCLADGFTNLLYPTSGIMIIAIGLIGVSYGKWLKFSWPLFVAEGIVSVAIMLLAVRIGYA